MKKIGTILLIDDDEIDNMAHARLIKKLEFADSVIVHQSPLKALEFLNSQSVELSCWPDLIFLDINMPLMNGFEFLKKFEEFPSELKGKTSIIMLSSSLNPDDQLKAENNGLVKKFFIKPLKKEMIFETFT